MISSVDNIKNILGTVKDLHCFNYRYDNSDVWCQISYGISLHTLNTIQQKIPNYDIIINVNDNKIELFFRQNYETRSNRNTKN